MGFLSLIAKLGIDTSGYETGLKRAESLSNKWANKVGSDVKSVFMGTFGATAMYEGMKEAFKGMVEYTKELHHLSEQSGMTPEQIQKLSKAAKRFGLDFEDVQTSISKFTGTRMDAVKDEEARKRFKRLGVDIEDLLDPAQNFFEIATKMGEALKQVKIDPQTRQDFREIFGKKGDRIIPAIRALPDTSLGMGGLTNQEVDRGWQYQRNIEAGKRNAKGISTRLFQALINNIRSGGFTIQGGINEYNDAEEWKKLQAEKEKEKGKQPQMIDELQKKREEDHTKEVVKLYEMGNKILMERMGIEDQIKYKKREITALEIAAANATAEELPKLKDQIDLANLELMNAKYGADKVGSGFHKTGINSLQQIGAFSGVDPILRGVDRSNAFLAEIARNTRHIPGTYDTSDSY